MRTAMSSAANNFPPVAGAAERAAFMRLYLEIGNALRDSFLRDNEALKNDADVSLLVRITAAVILGHSEGRPMTAHKLAQYLNIDRATAKRKLDKMVRVGSLVREGEYYLMQPTRAEALPPEVEERFCRAFYDAVKALVPFWHLHPNFGVTVQIEH